MRLGIILPDAGADQSEWLRLGPWFDGREVCGVDTSIVLSPSDGRHDHEALRKTANINHLLRAGRILSLEHCDAIVWACTSGSFIGGRLMAEGQNSALTRATRLPVTNASLALVAAAGVFDADRVDVLSPYPQSVTQAFLEFLSEMSIETVRLKSLGCSDGQASFELDLRTVLSEFQSSGPTSPRPILVPDTAINSLDLIEEFEAETGRIVVTANQATLWHGMRLMGFNRPVERAGALFRSSRSLLA